MGARQSLTERQPENPVEEGAERLRSSTDCDPERRQRCDVLRTMRDVWESVAAHSPDHGGTGSRDDAEQSHSACVHREATGRDRTPLLATRTREHDDAGHADSRASTGTARRAVQPQDSAWTGAMFDLWTGESFEGADANMVLIGDDEDTVPLKVQGQLKGVDQEACLQLIL